MFGLGVNRLGATNQKPFSPASLFNKGEAGVWYDPSAASGSLDWRKNLLEYTESFDNPVWIKTSMSVVANQTIAPDGTQTADKCTPVGGGIHLFGLNHFIGAGNNTASVYMKKGTGRYGGIRLVNDAFGNDRYSVLIDLETGSFVSDYSTGNPPVKAYKIDDSGNGWYRLSVMLQHSTSTMNVSVFTNNDNTPAWATTALPEYTANGTDYIYAWGAQLEEASTASSYQPILSTFENAFKTAFPSHTLYQDSQGVTPVTAVGEPVGLMLDKSKGLAQGPEQVTNGDFSNGTTGWTAQTGWAIANGVATCSSGSNYLYQLTGIPANTWVTATVEITDYTSGTLRLGSTGFAPTQFFSGLGKHSITFKTWASVGGVELRSNSFVGTIDNVSVTEIQGSHATQPTSTKRPIYARHPEGGIRNLLNYTEQFDNGYWTKFAGATASGTTINLPATSDRVFSNYTPLSNTAYTYSAILSGSGTVTLQLQMGGVSSETQVTLTATPTKHSFTVTTTSAAAGFVFIRKRGSDTATTLTCDGVQLEYATEASNYQKVVTDIDVTESGVGEVYYLKFDGVDDGMSINSLTSPSTPLTALFGYSATNAESTTFRWLLDIETGRTIFGASGNTAGRVGYYDGGTAWRQIDASINADAIKVLTYDLVANNAKMRVDGTQEYSDTSYIQRSVGGLVSLFSTNAGDNQFLAGNMYQTILRAAESTDEEIAKAETYVANKTGLKAQVDGIATLDLNFGANLYTAKNSNGGVI